MSQLADLSRPFPSKYIKTNPSGGGSYVKHHIVKQALLLTCGPFDWHLVEILRGYVAGKAPNPQGTSARAKAGTPDLENAIVGMVWRLTVTIDGKVTVVESVGDCEEPHNWPHDGARAKDAESDAFKRCCMQFSLGLHLWSQDEYFLREKLREIEQAREQTPPTPASAPSPTEPQSVGQELGSGASTREGEGAERVESKRSSAAADSAAGVATPDPTLAVESSPLPDAPVNEGTAAAPAVPSPKERADRLAEKAKRPTPADHTVSAHEAKQ